MCAASDTQTQQICGWRKLRPGQANALVHPTRPSLTIDKGSSRLCRQHTVRSCPCCCVVVTADADQLEGFVSTLMRSMCMCCAIVSCCCLDRGSQSSNSPGDEKDLCTAPGTCVSMRKLHQSALWQHGPNCCNSDTYSCTCAQICTADLTWSTDCFAAAQLS